MESQDQAQPQAPPSGTAGFRPEIFGKYYLLDRIAIGGMAEVFRAKTFGHSGFEKLHVIKRILAHYADLPDFEAMFVDEAKLSVQLVHPNVVHIYDFGKIGTNLYLAMEAVDGKNLKLFMRRLAKAGERMPVKVAVYIAHEMAKGLDYAHKRKDAGGAPLRIVHRDISPANILLSYEGGVKVVDFGIARAESNQPEPDDVIKGKFQYMSPEQAARTSLDHRSDLFSAGICLWEMLTGNRLFQRSTDKDTVEAILTGTIPLPSSFNPAVPSELDRVVLQALALDPHDRYPDGAAFQRELQDFLLPDTPDRLAPALSNLLRDRFSAEIDTERSRLEQSTSLVSDLHYGGELDLEMEEDESDAPALGSIRPAQTTPPPTPAAPPLKDRRTLPLVVAMVVLLGGLGLWQMRPSTPSGGVLTVDIAPEAAAQVARVTLDGTPIDGRVEGVEPLVRHVLRVEADGFATREKSIELVAGQVFSVEFEMQADAPEPTPAPEATPEPPDRPATAVARPAPTPTASPTPEPEAKASTLTFESEPDGAKVFIDGRAVGRTPFAWTTEPDAAFNVEFRLPGHNSAQAVARSPSGGESAVVFRELKPKENAVLGRLSVTALPGWARVYINGEFVKTTPLYEHELKPGTYELRLTNERLGVDIKDKVSIGAGAVTRKSYRLDE